MAYNPFSALRKQQRTLMAVLVGVSMLTFIMTSGSFTRGDPIMGLMDLFGGRRSSDVGVLNGRRVTREQLDTVRRQRVLAVEYMRRMVQAALTTTQQKLATLSNNLTKYPALQKVAGQAMAEATQFDGLIPNIVAGDGRGAMFKDFLVGTVEKSRSTLRTLQEFQKQEKKTAEAELLGQLRDTLGDELQLLRNLTANGGRSYFGGTQKTESLLDFMLWREEANRLGIRLTDADVNTEIGRDTLACVTAKVATDVETRLAANYRQQGFSVELLAQGLLDEFRVRMAKAALLTPPPAAPDEFWAYYKENRAEVSVGLLDVPVRQKQFLDAVPAPTEAELKALFEKYKKADSRPDSPTPGFRQPQRIQVAFVGARPDQPVYRERAGRVAKMVPGLQGLLAAAGPGATASPVATALQVSVPVTFDFSLLERYQNNYFTYLAPSRVRTDVEILPDSVNRVPIPSTAVVGNLLANILPPAPGGVIPGMITENAGRALARELHERARFEATTVLAAAMPGSWTALGLEAVSTPRYRYEPYEVVEETLRKEVLERFAQRLADADLNQLKADIEAKEKAHDKPEAIAAMVAEAVKRYGWISGSTTGPQSQATIAGDPGLAPLVQAIDRRTGPTQLPQENQAGNQLFSAFKPFTPEYYPLTAGSVGREEEAWREAAVHFLYWKTSLQEAHVPEKLELVRAEVEDAYRFDAARKLAKAEAERVEKLVKAFKGDEQKLRDLSVQDKAIKGYQVIGPVAPMVPNEQPDFMSGPTGPRRNYQVFNVPNDRVPNAGPQLNQKVRELKALGDTALAANAPESAFYVATVVRETPAELRDFYISYQDANPAGFKPDTIYERFIAERQAKYQDDVVRQLRESYGLKITKADAEPSAPYRPSDDE